MKDKTPEIPVVPITRLRRRSPAGFEVVACPKEHTEKEHFITPGDVVIWTCAGAVVIMIVWACFGIGHMFSYVYRSVSGAVDVDSLKKELTIQAPAQQEKLPPNPNIAAADREMDERSNEIKKNFNEQWGDSLNKFFEATKGLSPSQKKNQDVGTF